MPNELAGMRVAISWPRVLSNRNSQNRKKRWRCRRRGVDYFARGRTGKRVEQPLPGYEVPRRRGAQRCSTVRLYALLLPGGN